MIREEMLENPVLEDSVESSSEQEKTAPLELTSDAQAERIGDTEVFVLPNPSGRNANFSYAEMLAAFRSLKRRVASKSKLTEV